MDAQPITRSLWIAWVLAIASLLGCSQGAGETCQRDRDCEDGLVCLQGRGGTERSVCGTPDEAMIEPDAGEEPTLPPDDAGRDAGGDEPGEEDAGDEPADVDAG